MVDQKGYKFFFSNDLEILAEKLYLEWRSICPTRPQYLLLPSAHSPWKEWMLYFWSKRNPSFALCSLEWMEIEDFFSLVFQGEKTSFSPLTEDQIFFLLQEIFESLPREPALEALHGYLRRPCPSQSHSLRRELARLFSLYGVYGLSQEKVWLQKKTWQEYLWSALFDQKSYSCPFQGEAFLPDLCKDLDGVVIHLFGFSFLPPLYLQRLHQISQNASLIQYHFSASPLYWQDMRSRRSYRFAAKREGNLVGLKEIRHEVLSQCGRIEQQFFPLCDAYNFATEEGYRAEFPMSVLGHLQRSFFEAEEKSAPLFADDSICVFGAFGSKLREVEALIDQIFSWKRKDPSLILSDIAVYAPDISAYTQAIDLACEQAGLAYHVEERPAIARSLFLQAFLCYLQLVTGAFRKEDLLDFFSLSPVHMQFQASKEQVARVCQFFTDTELLFGIDQEHARESTVGKNKDCFIGHDWESVCARLFRSLMMEKPETVDPFSPPLFPSISWQDRDWLEPFLRCFSHLRSDRALLKEKRKGTLFFWSAFLEERIRLYFFPKLEEGNMRQEVEALLLSLRQFPGTGMMTFRDLVMFLEERLEKKIFFSPRVQECVLSFRGLREASTLPAKIICLLGMSEDAFPRQEKKRPLDLLDCYVPKRGDIDRSVFLQILLSAQKRLYVSYQKKMPSDGKDLAISPLVHAVLLSIEEQFGIPKEVWQKEIPIAPNHPSLFQEKGAYRCYSQEQFSLAKTLLEEREKPLFLSLKEREPSPLSEVFLADIVRFSKHPLRFFLQKQMNITLPYPSVEETGFFLSPLDRFLQKKEWVGKEVSPSCQVLEKSSASPVGIFSLLAEQQLSQARSLLFSSLQKANMGSTFATELPVSFTIPREDSSVAIRGTLDGVHPNGLWTLREKTITSLLELWPKALCYLVQEKKTSCMLYFLGKEKVAQQEWIVEDPVSCLQRYLTYFSLSLVSPSPLIPFWAKELVTREEAAFVARAKKWKEEKDPYLSWVFLQEAPSSFSTLYREWHPFFTDLFIPVFKGEVQDVV